MRSISHGCLFIIGMSIGLWLLILTVIHLVVGAL